MNDALQKIRQETLDRLKEVREEKELEALNVSVLGRNGALTEILRTMGKLDKEQRAKLGQRRKKGTGRSHWRAPREDCGADA